MEIATKQSAKGKRNSYQNHSLPRNKIQAGVSSANSFGKPSQKETAEEANNLLIKAECEIAAYRSLASLAGLLGQKYTNGKSEKSKRCIK